MVVSATFLSIAAKRSSDQSVASVDVREDEETRGLMIFAGPRRLVAREMALERLDPVYTYTLIGQ